jgi:predicted HicB family RNase H-like nuclease
MVISKDKVRANLVIDKELKKRLEEIAKSKNRSFNNLIITILIEYLEEEDK